LKTLTHVFDYEWEDVASASWRKYPTACRPDILSVDTVSRRFDPETGKLWTVRLITTSISLPGWMKAFFSNPVAYSVEECEVDPVQRTMLLRTRNITAADVTEVEESCFYTPHADDEGRTTLQQNVRITAHVFGLAGRVEALFLEKFEVNAIKGREVMVDAVKRVQAEMDDFVALYRLRMQQDAPFFMGAE